jgi:hypothetical protein
MTPPFLQMTAQGSSPLLQNNSFAASMFQGDPTSGAATTRADWSGTHLKMVVWASFSPIYGFESARPSAFKIVGVNRATAARLRTGASQGAACKSSPGNGEYHSRWNLNRPALLDAHIGSLVDEFPST